MIKHNSGRIGAVIAVVLVGAYAFAGSADAKPPSCQVVNVPPKRTVYSSSTYENALGTAISEASAGDTLQVKGICHGNFVIDKNLTLIGPASDNQQATLDADTQGSVLTVEEGVTVAIKNVTVTRGVGSHPDYRGRLYGGGIFNSGTLTLKNSAVIGNTASGPTDGAYGAGAGIWNIGTLTLSNSRVENNSTRGPGGGIASLGTVTLNDSTINGNSANGIYNPNGGGIYNGGTLTLNGSSSVWGNSAAFYGGGIDNTGTVTLNDSSTVSGNTADGMGGGIYSYTSGGLVNCVPGLGGNVFGNAQDDIFIETT